LCVDLDGTLIRTDCTWESLVNLLRRSPLCLPLVLVWLMRGRAHLKSQLAQRSEVDAAVLPYDQTFLEFLRAERKSGRSVLLVTASDRRVADRIQEHLGLFTEVLGSDGALNLRGKDKSARL
jgi:phosphoserine phosphatase